MPHYLFTSNARGEGGVYLLDSGRGTVRKLLRGSYRGLTRGPEGGFYTVSGYRNPTRDTTTLHRLEPRTWCSEEIGRYPVKDSHDLRWIDGAFYLVASVGNQILKLAADGRVLDRMQLVPDERDICHVNCVIQHRGELYCTLFTLSPGERREKHRRPEWFTEGKLLRLDFAGKTFSVVYEPLFQPHSLVEEDGGLYLLESHHSVVSHVDPRAGTRRVLRQYRGFLRGLAFAPRERVIGVNEMYRPHRRRLRPLPWLQQWLEERFPFSGLLVTDESWRVRRRVRVPGAEVYDVLLLNPEEVASPAA